MGKSSATPQPVNPYVAAGAQYGLNTGTAAYNAGLNRTGVSNPVGSSGWSVQQPTSTTGTGGLNPTGWSPGQTAPNPNAVGTYGVGSVTGGSSAPPLYTFHENLGPGFNPQPLNTSGIYGAGGGPAPIGGLQPIANSLYAQQAGYFLPEQALQSEQESSLLANEGATPGSAAYNNAEAELGRQQTFQQQQAANAAITGATGQEATLQNIGLQGLQAQEQAGEFGPQLFSMMSGGNPSAYAGNTDILGAFQNQYQGQLNSANATNAANNQATGDAAGLLASYLMYAAMT